MSVRTEVLLWAQRILARRGTSAHALLEVPKDCDLDTAQAAFHKVARLAHPDLHRTTLAPEELELVTSAYAHVAAAYAEVRGNLLAARPTQINDALTQPMAAVTPRPSGGGTPGAAQAMSSKALLYYRKAELCLRRGELKGAVLQLKLAIAADPHSALLRAALAEVEPEVSKKS